MCFQCVLCCRPACGTWTDKKASKEASERQASKQASDRQGSKQAVVHLEMLRRYVELLISERLELRNAEI